MLCLYSLTFVRSQQPHGVSCCIRLLHGLISPPRCAKEQGRFKGVYSYREAETKIPESRAHLTEPQRMGVTFPMAMMYTKMEEKGDAVCMMRLMQEANLWRARLFQLHEVVTIDD